MGKAQKLIITALVPVRNSAHLYVDDDGERCYTLKWNIMLSESITVVLELIFVVLIKMF